MGKYKLTIPQQRELRELYESGDVAAAKKRAIELGVSPYYGSILSGRRKNKSHSRGAKKKWDRAVEKGPVLA